MKEIREIIAPTLDERYERGQKFKEISLYLVIALISLTVVCVVPLLSGCLKGDIGFGFPKTAEGWVLYWSINGGTTAGNVALFILFKQQAKTNSKKHPNYIKAQEILKKHNGEKGFIPRSPAQMNKSEYTKKICTIMFFSTASFITISSLVISFDFITFLSTFVSVAFALVMGWVTMIKNEAYWTDEYLQYALYIEKKKQIAQSEEGEKNDQIRQQGIEKHSGTSTEECE